MIEKVFYILGDKKKNLLSLLLLIIINLILEIFTLSALIPLLNNFINQEKYYEFIKQYNFIFDNNIENLSLYLVVIFFTSYIAKTLIYTFVNIKIAKFSQNFSRDLSSILFKKYLFSQYSFFYKKNSAELIRNLTSENDGFFVLLHNSLLIIVDLFISLSLIIFLFFYQPLVTLFLVLLIFVFCFFYLKFSSNPIVQVGGHRILFSKLAIKQIQETFSLIKEIKLFSKEKIFFSTYSNYNNKLRDANLKFRISTILPRPVIEIFLIAIVMSIIFCSLNFGVTLSSIVISLTIYSVAGLKLFPSFSNFIVRFNAINFRKSSLNLIYYELKNTSLSEDDHRTKIKFKNFINITLRNVHFNYPNSKKKILNNFNLEIKKNKIYLLLGPNGSGKSTLLNIISGLISPTRGNIFLNKNLINKNENFYLKNLVGYVSQNVFLADRSILYNITFETDIKKINNKLLKSVINISDLNDIINEMPNKINTIVGQNGLLLSGGQIQRIAIARALYKDPSILIFDEATNGIDVYSKNKILNTIKKLKNNKTLILVTHDKEIINKYKKNIIRLNKNKIFI